MDQSAKQGPASRIFISSVIESKDPEEERMERANMIYQSIVKGLSDRDANDALNAFVSKGPAQHKDVQLGLLYNILAEPSLSAKCFQDMLLVSRDGFNTVVPVLVRLVTDKWLKLAETTRVQITWLTRELIKHAVKDSDELYLWLLRSIVGGDTSSRNIWLIETLLDTFLDHRPWLEKSQSPRDLVASVVYTYLRLIVDHKESAFSMLRQREVELCITLLREKWAECLVIGRDLARLLQLVARISEFEKLWRDIFLSPSSLSPGFTGIKQLMSLPTKKHFLASRVTLDMERKLNFLLLNVQFGHHKRYQEWFQRMYLSTPESQTLRCDLIRFICGCIHPSNQTISSNIMPRWAVIGWLLTTCTSNVAASDAKLALFFDWLFFDATRDSIMNIEPGILVMYHSMKPHPAITATLLDFMCRIMNNFCPRYAAEIKEGFFTALRTIIARHVLISANTKTLHPLFDNPKLDRELRALVHQNFFEFCNQDAVKEEPLVRERAASMDNGNHISDGIQEASFSDDEDDIPLGKTAEESSFRPIFKPPEKGVDITEHLDQLPPAIKDLTAELQSEINQEMRCDLLDRLMKVVIQEDDFDDIASSLASCLCQILKDQVNKNIFPHHVDEDSIEDSIDTPLFVIFRCLSQMSEEDPRTQPLLQLMGEMYERQPCIGYYLLYFLKVSKNCDEKMVAYKEFCSSLDERDFKSCLLQDLKLCAEDDVRLFTYLIPDIYTQFAGIAVGNAELVHMIVENIDGTQLQDLICQILQGHLIIFNKKETFLSILNESLKWETIEQYFLWQLITAHNIPIEHMLPVLPMLEYTANAEALTSLMVLLKQESPSAELLRPMLCRECKKMDYFVVSVLKYWAQEYEDRLAELIKEQLTRLGGTTHANKNKRSKSKESKKDQPSMEQVLAHLDHMRQVCRNISFLNHEKIQHALQEVQAAATDSQKNKFSDLLALAEDIEDTKTTRVLRGRRGANSSPKMSKTKRSVPEESDSNYDTEEEENTRHPPKKKKKIAQPALDEESE
ncbi:hypothetical protein V1264_001450 [Littorina saxatilis]